MRSGAVILRSVAITDSAVMRPVLGFSLGTFSIDMEKLALSATTSMAWVLRVRAGSAQISMVEPSWAARVDAVFSSDSLGKIGTTASRTTNPKSCSMQFQRRTGSS